MPSPAFSTRGAAVQIRVLYPVLSLLGPGLVPDAGLMVGFSSWRELSYVESRLLGR